ncbi:MAG: ATP-binding cassette domain-containing protein [Bacteroidales bacterium]|nr:ATP-binding cassette domain-containing protein [Bacteroidales bacterium]
MITIKELNLSYGDLKVIRSLDLSLAENRIHGIVGLNGAGKTTLLNAIYGLKKINSGAVVRDGAGITKKEMSFLPTENFFYSNITAAEYLSLFKNTHFETENWNKLFKLPLDQIVDSYSTGMKKKLAIMAVIKQDKPIMILDEPFNSLDLETSRVLRSIFIRMREKGKTLIVTSHIIETLTNLCDQIHYLENGKIMFSKEKSEFSEFEKELFQSIEEKNTKLISDLI